MNHLKTVIIDSLEGNKHITHMDLRDNQLTDLDLSSLCSLEQLHCERNQLRELTLSGFSLRTLYASWNSEFSTQPPVFVFNCSLSLLRRIASVVFLSYSAEWSCVTP